jgi:hypothetical protein
MSQQGYSQSTVFESNGDRAVQRTTVCKNGRCEERTTTGRLAPQRQAPQQQQDGSSALALEDDFARASSPLMNSMWDISNALQSASSRFGSDQLDTMFDDMFAGFHGNRHHVADWQGASQPGKSWSKSVSSSSTTQNGHTWTDTKKCVNGVCSEKKTSTEDSQPLADSSNKGEHAMVSGNLARKGAHEGDSNSDSEEEQAATAQSTSVSEETVIENGKMVTKITKCVNGKCTTTTKSGEVKPNEVAQPSAGSDSGGIDSGGAYNGMVF